MTKTINFRKQNIAARTLGLAVSSIIIAAIFLMPAFAKQEQVCSRSDVLFCEDWEWSTSSTYKGTATDWQSHGWDANQGDLDSHTGDNVYCKSSTYGYKNTICAYEVSVEADVSDTLYPLHPITNQGLGSWTYARFYVKFSPGYLFNGYQSGNEQKLAYFRSDTANALVWRVEMQVTAKDSSGSTGVWQINPSPPHDIKYDCNQNGVDCTVVPGQWYNVEFAVHMPTSGADNNGGLRVWIDGKLAISKDNIVITAGSTTPITSFWLSTYYGGTPGDPHPLQYVWYDNIVVATNPIGPIEASSDTTPPTLSNPQPSGTLPSGTTSTTMSVTSNENANCKFSITANVAYSSMTNTFVTTGGTAHSTLLMGLTNGQTYTRYVRCLDTSGNANTNDFIVSFSVANTAFDFSLTNGGIKTITQGQSTTNTITSTLSSGTTQSVSFSSSGFPTGTTSSFSPTSCNPTCTTTLSINTINSTPSGNYTINVNGVGAGLTRTTNFQLTVNPIVTNSCSWDFFPEGNIDGKVTLGDVLVAVNNFGKTSASPGFNSKMDFNNNNQIDLFDVLTVLAHFGGC